MKSKVSIIVPIYNAEKKIEKSINSLINQSYKNIEIILIDDGSTDESLEICEKLKNKDDRIKVYSKKNGGVSSARNYGISKSNGKYICFVDSDDTVENDFCEILVKKIEKDNSDLSCCYYNVINNDNMDKITKNIYKNNSDNKYIMIFKNYKGFLWNKLYKKDIIDKYNLKLNEDISMCEDLLFNFQYLEKCNKVSYCNESAYNYFTNDNSLSKGLNMNWFDILYVYNYIYIYINNYDSEIQDIIMLEFLYAIFETKMRAKIMNIDERNIFMKYNIDFYNIYKKYYKKLLYSRNINIKEKIKLIIFCKLEWLARYIKFRKR